MRLRHIDPSELSALPIPTKKIYNEFDIPVFKSTRGYADYVSFLQALNDAVRGRRGRYEEPVSDAIRRTEDMLTTLRTWIDEIPPMETPQRFGNLSFRKWGLRLIENADSLLANLLPPYLHSAIPYLKPYLTESFGNTTRMDYGTGHETSFAMLLCCLSMLEFFQDEADHAAIPLHLFPTYLSTSWALQDTYNLEPAGSHGVWGLDDSSFLGYLWGSGQMKGNDDNEPPIRVLDYIKNAKQPPKALPSTIHTQLATSPKGEPPSLYHLHLLRILSVKSGPFFEHSSQLYNIATGVKTWTKVNEGMGKMYDAEVLSKHVVVQHIPLGGILAWDPSGHHTGTEKSLKDPVMAEEAEATGRLRIPGDTAVPWATQQITRGLLPPTAAPWTR